MKSVLPTVRNTADDRFLILSQPFLTLRASYTMMQPTCLSSAHMACRLCAGYFVHPPGFLA